MLEQHNTSLVFCSAALIFIFDRFLPLYLMPTPVYTIVVLMSLWSTKTRTIYFAAALCSVLTILDALLTHSPWGAAFALLNRGLAVGVYRTTAVICMYNRRRTELETRIASAERALDESREARVALTRAGQAETQAREAANRLEFMRRAGRIGAFDIDLTGKNTYVSSTFPELHGFPPTARAARKEYFELLGPEDRERWHAEEAAAAVRPHQARHLSAETFQRRERDAGSRGGRRSATE